MGTTKLLLLDSLLQETPWHPRSISYFLLWPLTMSMTKEQAAEVARLESEAQAKAAKHVANMLARPDQLEKVAQLTWRVSRKKASVEAMLKTAMQSQLDGVRTGLNQLEKALLDISDIKTCMADMETA